MISWFLKFLPIWLATEKTGLVSWTDVKGPALSLGQTLRVLHGLPQDGSIMYPDRAYLMSSLTMRGKGEPSWDRFQTILINRPVGGVAH